jgi:dienelactone hydrolase
MKRFALALVIVSAAAGAPAPQPDTAAARHEAVVAQVKKLAADISARPLSDVATPADLRGRRDAMRRELLYALGLEPMPRRTPLQATVVGTVRRAGYRVEKVVFQSLPRLYVTANFYLPESDAPPAKLPTVLYVCGHAPDPAGAKVQYQDRGIAYARGGYACLVVDTLEFGEVPGLHHGIHDLNRWDWLSRGYTPAGVEVWNAVRAIDYLETRPEVDAKRIGITGISGGGAVTWFAAAVDERVAAAASVCGTWTFGTQAEHWRAAGQCDCIYFNNTFLSDLPTAGALIAPRPLLICGGRKDADFPPDGYRGVFEKLRRVYGLEAGGAERVRLVDEDVGHTDSPLFRAEARLWMDRWLKHGAPAGGAQTGGDAEKLTAAELACFAEPPADAINDRIDTLFIPTATFEPEKFPALPGWEQRRREMLAGLRDKVFRAFPREPGGLNERPGRADGGWAARYADYREVFIDTEGGVPVRLQVLRPKEAGRRRAAPVVIYAKRAGDSIYAMDFDELLPLLGRCTVIVLNPRLTEHPVSAFERAELERSASWVGRTVASMQVWDILRAVDWVARQPEVARADRQQQTIVLYGRGDMAALALYAGLLDDRVGRVVLNDPPATHRWRSWGSRLNVLRVTAVAVGAAEFARGRLVFVPEVPPAYEPARKVYRLHKRADEITATGSLAEAVGLGAAGGRLDNSRESR